MTVEARVIADLKVRSELLPAELKDWDQRADQDLMGMGIHRSQVGAIRLTLRGLLTRQNALLSRLTPDLDAESFAQRRTEMERVLTNSHALAAVFRYIFGQRAGAETYGAALDAADHIAAGCYRPSVKLAARWQALPEAKFRVPPLSYLHTVFMPAALTRRHAVTKVGLALDALVDQKMPVSVIALPFHQAAAFWSYCGIYHEVGHLLDQDLGLSAALDKPFNAALTSPDHDRGVAWGLWLRELVADAFGVIFGGVAFLEAMSAVLLYGHEEVTSLTTDEHPPGYLRIALIAALVRGLGVAVQEPAVAAVERAWRARYAVTSDLEPYLAEAPAAARILLRQPLTTALKNHTLRDFAEDPAREHARIEALAAHLSGGPFPPEAESWSLRLLPAAAQRAVTALATPDEPALKAIHDAALATSRRMRRDKWMTEIGAFPPAQDAYFRRLVEDMRLDPPGA